MILLTLALLVQDGTATLNDGARVTNSSTVQLRVRVSAAAGLEMSISDGPYKPYIESQPLELPAGDGEKKVVVKLRDAAGKDVGTYTASIVLDTTPPEAKVKVPDGIAAGRVTLLSDVPDAVAMQWTEDATRWGPWVPYLQPRDIALSPGDGTKTVLVRYRDEAGNVSKPASLRVESKGVSDVSPLRQVLVTSEPALTLWLSYTGVTEMVVQVDDDKPLPREPFASKKPFEVARRGGAHRVRLSLFEADGVEHKVELAFQEADVKPTTAEPSQESSTPPGPWSLSAQGGLLPSAIEFEAQLPSGLRKIKKDALGLARLSLSRDLTDRFYAQVGFEYAGGGGIRVYSGTFDVGAHLLHLGSVDLAAEAGLLYSDLKITESAFGSFDAGLGFRGGVRAKVAVGDRLSLDATVDYRRVTYDYSDPVVSGDRQARLQTVGLLLGASLRF